MTEISSHKEEQAKKLLQEGAAALAIGKIADAERAFNTALETIPNYGPANFNLGLVRLEQGKAVEAEPFVVSPAKAMPSVETYTLLGRCYEKLGRLEEAVKYFRIVLENTPQNDALWAQYANLLQILGRNVDAENALRKCLDLNPTNVKVAIDLGWICWRRHPPDAIALLKKTLSAVQNDERQQVKILGKLVMFEEWEARIKKNRAPYHAASLNDLFYHYAKETFDRFKEITSKLARHNQSDHWAQMTNGLALFASGKHAEAQKNFQMVAEATGNAMATAIRFDEQFFSYLSETSEADLLEGLPALEVAQSHEFDDGDILYLSCNATYFDDFAVPLLRSLNAISNKSRVHIHLMDSSPEHTELACEFCQDLRNIDTAISVERPDFQDKDIVAVRSYFHAIRFIRFYQHLKTYDQTLWLMDVDGLFNQPPDGVFSGMGQADVAMRVRPGRLEPWNQLNACMVGVRPSEAGLRYIHLVSAYIAHFYKRDVLPWGIDQLAMYSAFHDLQRREQAPDLFFLDDTVLDYEYRDDGIVWCSSGSTKYTALNRGQVENDPDATAFDRAFARYASANT